MYQNWFVRGVRPRRNRTPAHEQQSNNMTTMRTGSNKMSESEPAAAAAMAAAVDSQRGNTAAAVTPSPSQAARNRDFASSSFSGTRLDFSDDGARPVAKRQKTAEDDTNACKGCHLVTDLPTDILARCIQILGPGHHRFVAGSCRALRLAHREAFEGKDSVAIETTFEDTNNQKYRSIELEQVKKKMYPAFATFGSTITSSETTALFKIWENETTGEYQGQEINIIREAIALGTQPQNARVTKTLSRTGALGCSAARHGNLSLLSHLLASYPDSCALEKEGENGSNGVPYRFHQLGGKEMEIKGNKVPMSWTESAAEAGQLDVCQWLFEITKQYDETERESVHWSSWYSSPTAYYHLTHSHYAVHAACRCGQWDVFKWALRDPCALMSGNTDGGEYLGACLIPIGKNGDRDIVRWISGLNSKYPSSSRIPLEWAGVGAAEVGRTDMLDALLEFGFFEVDNNRVYAQMETYCSILGSALCKARFNVLHWVETNIFPNAVEIEGEDFYEEYATVIYQNAAIKGGLEVVKWVHSTGFPLKEFSESQFCIAAAAQDDLQLLQWLRAKGCTWNHRLTHYAKANGHEEIYQWAVKNGCPVEEEEGDY